MYEVVRYSQRGFSNEHTYLYGTDEEIHEYYDEYVSNDPTAKWEVRDIFHFEEDAKELAEQLAQEDIDICRANGDENYNIKAGEVKI